MRQLTAIIMMLCLASCASAAKLEFSMSAPRFLSRATSCLSDSTAPLTSITWTHWRWEGIQSGTNLGEDSLITIPGQRVIVSKNVASGIYRVSAWASNGAGGGCRDTIMVEARVPGRVQITK